MPPSQQNSEQRNPFPDDISPITNLMPASMAVRTPTPRSYRRSREPWWSYRNCRDRPFAAPRSRSGSAGCHCRDVIRRRTADVVTCRRCTGNRCLARESTRSASRHLHSSCSLFLSFRVGTLIPTKPTHYFNTGQAFVRPGRLGCISE